MGVLYAWVGGAWVPVSGDTGAANGAAWGVMATGVLKTTTASYFEIPQAVAAVVVTDPLTFTPLADRRYRVVFIAAYILVVTAATSVTSKTVCRRDTAQLGDRFFQIVPASGSSTNGIMGEWLFVGDGAPHTFTVEVVGVSSSILRLYYPQQMGLFYIEDVGPVR